jgi:chorismate synthase
VEVVARNVPAGWGAPVFDKLEAQLAAACLSIPACRGFEVSDPTVRHTQLSSASILNPVRLCRWGQGLVAC